MRRALMLAAVLEISAHPARPAPKATFEIKGYVAGAELSSTAIDSCEISDPKLCHLKTDKMIAGTAPIIFDVVSYDDRLSSVTIIPKVEDFEAIIEAMKAKYGAPCNAGIGTWANALGAKLQNPFFDWCFSSGILSAKMLGSSLDFSSIEYTDRNQPPPMPAKVDF